ncbi:S1C family serine protease [Paenibacillus caseinilyticus]|uniref:Serine protease n=1 Tax=Paenibacillus mucilaginosus K02 TaxID=997761 RepID=I0BJV9_9BACL|nr:trypsin-like peptidase domain-containing protein [Paenibacillus mucilaginosus]AFH62656.1 serine protease [Paenibacillus mucilaginosus K02]
MKMGHEDRDSERPGGKTRYVPAGLAGLAVGGALLLGLVIDGAQPQQTAGSFQLVNEAPNSSIQDALAAPKGVLDVSDTVEKVASSVVGITNIQDGSSVIEQAPSSEGLPAGEGSGVIYKKADGKAYIVTNHHVVAGASQLEVTLSDNTKVPAALVGSDIWTDLAVITISADAAKTPIGFGDSSKLRIGEPVVAIGNPLGLRFAGSATSGIISGIERMIPIDVNEDGTPDFQSEALQTDAAINPGNSGGALVNLNGELVGINSMKISTEAVEGIGLAIPVHRALPVIQELEQSGKVQRPTIGVNLIDLAVIPKAYYTRELGLPADVTDGVVIERSMPGSAAAAAGLQSRDVITALDGQPVTSTSEFRQYLFTGKKAGDTLQVTFYRGAEQRTVRLTLTDNLEM